MSNIISLEENKLEKLNTSISKTKKMINDCKKVLKVMNNILNRDYKNLEEEQIDFIKFSNIEFEKTISSLTKLLGTLSRRKKKRIS